MTRIPRRFFALIVCVCSSLLSPPARAAEDTPPSPPAGKQPTWHEMAAEVTDFIQKHYWLRREGLYTKTIEDRSPEFVWGGGVMFTALVAASRHDRGYLATMRRYYSGLERYWDDKADPPGYEPAPTAGNGNDKYYDDNAWMVLMFLEAHELTGESRYLRRARETMDFVMSGWCDTLGGGIWWHEGKKDDSKNTCTNAPAAVGSFRLAKFSAGPEREKRIADGIRLIEWTTRTLRGDNGLFGDRIEATSGRIHRGQLTYNSALMLRASLCAHDWTGNDLYLEEAIRIGHAAEAFLNHEKTCYRDPLRWSHLMVEADLELHRKTGDETFLRRAATSSRESFRLWRDKAPAGLIDNASLARQLWLLADTETETGRRFWQESDQLRPRPRPPQP